MAAQVARIIHRVPKKEDTKLMVVIPSNLKTDFQNTFTGNLAFLPVTLPNAH